MIAQCHNCNSSDLEFLYGAPAFDTQPDTEHLRYDLCRCNDCALVNTVPSDPAYDSDEPEDAVYSETYYGSSTSKFLTVIEFLLKKATTARARKIIRLWRAAKPTSASPAVLDIGCGRGLLLRSFQEEGASVLGLERQEFPIDESCSDIVRAGALDDAECENRNFDIIILWHVLEHLSEHEKLLDNIKQHLNTGGVLALAVPNYDSLQQRLFAGHWFHLDLPRHLVHFESDWLCEQLERRGFIIEQQKHLDPVQNSYGFIQSTLNQISTEHQNAYYKLLKHGNTFSLRTLPAFLGWSVLAAALLPAAIIELIFSSFTRKGATVQIFAKLGTQK
ncbi:MAG: class I SAM-dependent methyltransferase [Halioglobus sp.]